MHFYSLFHNVNIHRGSIRLIKITPSTIRRPSCPCSRNIRSTTHFVMGREIPRVGVYICTRRHTESMISKQLLHVCRPAPVQENNTSLVFKRTRATCPSCRSNHRMKMESDLPQKPRDLFAWSMARAMSSRPLTKSKRTSSATGQQIILEPR